MHHEKKNDDADKYTDDEAFHPVERRRNKRARAMAMSHAPTATFWLTDIASEISSVVISSYFATIRFGQTSTWPGTTGFKFTNAKERGVS